MKVFKDVDGKTVDVVKHTLEVLTNYPNVEIHIGTDSQTRKRDTVYVTVIAYRYGTRGVHYIYTKSRVKKIKDLWTRLWKEAELSIESAEWLTSKINVRVEIEIDMDYSPSKKFDSNKLVSSARGWAQSLGYKVNIKPQLDIDGRTDMFENWATKCADKMCRG